MLRCNLIFPTVSLRSDEFRAPPSQSLVVTRECVVLPGVPSPPTRHIAAKRRPVAFCGANARFASAEGQLGTRKGQPVSEANEYAYASNCSICESPLELDEQVGYRCPHCGWDASFELDDDEEWIIPADRGDP